MKGFYKKQRKEAVAKKDIKNDKGIEKKGHTVSTEDYK